MVKKYQTSSFTKTAFQEPLMSLIPGNIIYSSTSPRLLPPHLLLESSLLSCETPSVSGAVSRS
ncbi:hypothetical protein KSS87_019392 [Heliosperma pusillum]|nr:hypothetical protein KSS87_019392 [Heliosperma pusillum]